MTRAPVPPEEASGLERLVHRTLGQGFKLAIVEIATPVEREALRAWLEELVAGDGGVVRGVDLSTLPGANAWQELRTALGEVESRTLLLLWGLEEAPGETGPEERLRQLNVQRDVLVRDLPVLWVLVLHPASREPMLRIAPDFCDFAARWIEAEPTPIVRAVTADLPRPPERMPPLPLESPPSPARELLEAGWEALQQRDFDAVGDALERLAVRQPLPDELETGRQVMEGYWRSRVGPHERAEALLQGILNLGSPLAVVAGIQLSALLAGRGRGSEAEAVARATEELSRGRGPDWETKASLALVRRLLELGKVSEALACSAKGLSKMAAAAPYLQGAGLYLHGLAHLHAGKLKEAASILVDEALPRVGASAGPGEVATLKGTIGTAFAALGRTTQATRWLEESATALRELDEPREYATVAMQLAELDAAQGRGHEALSRLRDEALPLLEKHGSKRDIAIISAQIARRLARLNRADEALALLGRSVIPALEAIGERAELASARRILALIQATRGRLGEAIRVLRGEVIPVYQAVGRLNDLAWARMELAELLHRRGEFRDRSEARRLVHLASAEAANDPRLAEAIATWDGGRH